MSRRRFLARGAAAAGTVGATWVAPQVRGLSLRPDHAQAPSASTQETWWFSGRFVSCTPLWPPAPDHPPITVHVARPQILHGSILAE